MGSVYRKMVTKPLPKDAEIVTVKGERVARWKDRRGKTKSAPLAGEQQDRIAIFVKTFTARYRTAAGRTVEKKTGCRDETAARSKLAEFERREELVRGGVLTAAENRNGRSPANAHC